LALLYHTDYYLSIVLGKIITLFLFVILHKNVWKCINVQNSARRNSRRAAEKIIRSRGSSLGLPGGIDPSLPHAPAILGSPAVCLADFGEGLGNPSAVLLGLSVADFVEVHHSNQFLSLLDDLIIAH
jgi:hypothetical protein